ncbi:carbohydrate binding domain-containing protein [Mucilaginibacter mali]|uniref:Carbohydrate binding domain-containing protein n=1 Tax=Mucilaginibacter mali TaxID=2740462 RepID=A0A7D4QBF3_9SPHI|nr:carbohydrate binding domain-containing protein [Mucilaginibacter mali]QKJ32631.1 carbohydrate binding domain-containing protein [Mucilaginibacter mali]
MKIANTYFFICCLTLAAISGISSAQVVVPNNNMILNGDFMSRDPLQRPTHWVMGTSLQTATLSGTERHGVNKDDQSLKVADTSAISNILMRTEKKIADPGSLYNAIAWVKTSSGKPAAIKLEFWDQNNVAIASKSATVEPTADWQQVKIELNAPDKCTHVTIAIYTGLKETGVSYWDDISLTCRVDYDPALKNNVRELFMDDYRVAEMVDVQRVVNPGVKSNILIKATEPWEGTSAYIYGTVLKDEPAGTGYRMWYCAYMAGKYFVCYATSKDGINWVKPKLGIVEYNGSKANNICRVGGGTVVYDPDDKDASRRYKMMSFDGEIKENFGYNVYFSPDGLHWTHYPKPVLPYGDVSNVAYDREKKLFIATTKQRMLVSNTSVTPGKNDRAAFVSVSTDFINWHAPNQPNSPFSLAVEGDPEDDRLVMSRGGIEANVYGMPVYPYQGIYIGFPWFFDIATYNSGVFAVTGDGKIQPQVASSRDLRHWSRPVRDPVIPLGKAGAWDDGTLYTSSNMQVDERGMTVYYGAMNLPHGGNALNMVQQARIAKATWRRDGFISLYNGGSDTGKVLTKTITFTGRQLKINAKLDNGGSLMVEILDKDGAVIDGYKLTQAKAITKDQYAATVQWNGGTDVSKLQGREIKLRFHLLGGNLYSYWFQ